MSNANKTPTQTNTQTLLGGCHCGKVRYRVAIDLSAGSSKCNCSICSKSGYWGTIVKPSAFELLSGEKSLSDYQFHTKSVHHLFCKHCGIRSFGRGNIPQIGGEFVSINLNCVEGISDDELNAIRVNRYNGRDDDWGSAA
jgi:hypothetical protein